MSDDYTDNMEVLNQLVSDRLLLGYSAHVIKDGKIIRMTDKVTSGELTIDDKEDKG